MTRHSRKWKEAQLAGLQKLADAHPVVAIASLNNFPSALAQRLRKKLQGKAVVRVSKTRVVQKALSLSKNDLLPLQPFIGGSVAVIFTSMDPFELFHFLKKNRGSVAAKEGMTAPDDIVVPAGDTGIPPGPALSDLKAAGLKTVVKGPTISIAEDKVVAKKGEVISKGVVGALGKLNIKPIKVGLAVVACIAKGQVFKAEDLDFDVEQVSGQFTLAFQQALNLAVELEYFTKETTELLIIKAERNARAVAAEAKFGEASAACAVQTHGAVEKPAGAEKPAAAAAN